MSFFSFACKFFSRSLKNYVKSNLGVFDHPLFLNKIKKDGFYPATVVDVGANKGEFSDLALSIFGKVSVLMIEPNSEYFDELRKKTSKLGVFFKDALVSDSKGPVCFKKDSTNSSVVLPDETGDIVKIESKLLDDIVSESNLNGPFLIKLDVQGHELKVLKGAIKLLAKTELVILEVSLIPLHSLAPKPCEIISFFEEHEFRLFDIYGFNRRPCNKDLWQVDWVFVKKSSILGNPNLGW